MVVPEREETSTDPGPVPDEASAGPEDEGPGEYTPGATEGAGDDAPAEADPEADPIEQVEALQEEVARLQNEISQLEDKLQRFTDALARAQADYQNLKKRAARERDEAALDARVGLVRTLVEVLDDVTRAGQAAPEGANGVAEGLELVVRRIGGKLNELGVVRIEPGAGDAFEPDVHEALVTAASEEHPPGSVLETLQPGYALQDRLVRPALVKVVEAATSSEQDALRPEGGPGARLGADHGGGRAGEDHGHGDDDDDRHRDDDGDPEDEGAHQAQ